MCQNTHTHKSATQWPVHAALEAVVNCRAAHLRPDAGDGAGGGQPDGCRAAPPSQHHRVTVVRQGTRECAPQSVPMCRQPAVDRCRPIGGGAVAAQHAEFCNSTGVQQQHCIHQKRYCQPDPDGRPDAGSNGRDALVEVLRTKCVDQVRRASHRHRTAGVSLPGFWDGPLNPGSCQADRRLL